MSTSTTICDCLPLKRLASISWLWVRSAGGTLSSRTVPSYTSSSICSILRKRASSIANIRSISSSRSWRRISSSSALAFSSAGWLPPVFRRRLDVGPPSASFRPPSSAAGRLRGVCGRDSALALAVGLPPFARRRLPAAGRAEGAAFPFPFSPFSALLTFSLSAFSPSLLPSAFSSFSLMLLASPPVLSASFACWPANRLASSPPVVRP